MLWPRGGGDGLKFRGEAGRVIKCPIGEVRESRGTGDKKAMGIFQEEQGVQSHRGT